MVFPKEWEEKAVPLLELRVHLDFCPARELVSSVDFPDLGVQRVGEDGMGKDGGRGFLSHFVLLCCFQLLLRM